MAIPDFQTLMLPVLNTLAEGERSTSRLLEGLADQFGLTPEERAQLLPSGRGQLFRNRIGWALTYLSRARLIERVSRGVYRLSDRGRSVLAAPPDRISIAFLRQFSEFRSLRPDDAYDGEVGETGEAAGATAGDTAKTPEERIEEAVSLIQADLRDKLLQRLRAVDPSFFEQVVLDLLVAMGYGSDSEASQLRGRAGDGGIDGVIREDRLGLDLIYVQAKRYADGNTVGTDRVREFSGALDIHGARKGVFLTTSRFTAEAHRFADQLQSKRIVLVDGERLAALLVQHGVGVRQKGAPIVLQELDLNYFELDEAE
jgi:restriction system protein